MRSLVTGGAGFIGSHVAISLLAAGHDVVVVDDLSGGFRDQVPAGATFIQGSILDYELLARTFDEHRFDYVYHAAAYAAEALSHFIRRFNYTQNVVGSANLINESIKHNVKCFVFTSSIAVYGRATVPMTEDMIPRPEDPYGVAKYAVEMDLRIAHEVFGLNYVIVRAHNVYGEHQNIGDRYRNVVGIFMSQAMLGQPMTVFGDGLQRRAYTYIDDVAPYIARSAEMPSAHGEIINLGSETPNTVLEIATTVSQAFGVSLRVQHLPARPNEPADAFSNHDKARRIFDMQPPVSIDVGVLRMAGWAKRAGSRRGRPFDDIEVTRRLPPSWLAT